MNIEPVFITEKGVKLYLDNDMVKILNKEIKRLNLKNIQAFLAVHPGDCKEYLLVKDGQPYSASQKAEDIESAINILALTQKFKK